MEKTHYIKYKTYSNGLRALTSRHQELIEEARRRYGPIKPCGSATTFGQCFSSLNGRLIFWFNTQDGSTRVVKTGRQHDWGLRFLGRAKKEREPQAF